MPPVPTTRLFAKRKQNGYGPCPHSEAGRVTNTHADEWMGTTNNCRQRVSESILFFFSSPDTPDTPGMPEVTEVGGDFVSLTWEKPKSDGGGRITGYWIEKREHGTDNWTRVNLNPCITNMINIPNLIEDRRYEFRVFAENEAGMSKPSMASNSVKIKDPNG